MIVQYVYSVYIEEGWNLSIEDIRICITGTQLAVLYMYMLVVFICQCELTLYMCVCICTHRTRHWSPSAVNAIIDLCGVSSPLVSARVCISLKIVCTDIRTYIHNGNGSMWYSRQCPL